MVRETTLRGSAVEEMWSIVAPRRAERPKPLQAAATADRQPCHFCEGNERETEPEVYAVRRPGSRPNSPGWSVRVVPNKYPALVPQQKQAWGGSCQTPYRQVAAHGRHEVIIETPDHDQALHTRPVPDLATVLRVYRDRLRALSLWPGVDYVALFRNDGVPAGASQEHPHAQALALPMVPDRVAREISRTERYYRRAGSCVTCAMLQQEYSDGQRLIDRNATFAAVTAFAPRFPYETWIVPTGHSCHFTALDDEPLSSLAALLQRVLRALHAWLGAVPFNLLIQSAPVKIGNTGRRAFHWRLEIVPRITTISGLELGTGIAIITTPPEEAARKLRSALAAG